MTKEEIKYFEDFLEDAFACGKISRELRLSTEEVEHLKKIYPRANVIIISKEEVDAKRWYLISFNLS